MNNKKLGNILIIVGITLIIVSIIGAANAEEENGWTIFKNSSSIITDYKGSLPVEMDWIEKDKTTVQITPNPNSPTIHIIRDAEITEADNNRIVEKMNPKLTLHYDPDIVKQYLLVGFYITLLAGIIIGYVLTSLVKNNWNKGKKDEQK